VEKRVGIISVGGCGWGRLFAAGQDKEGNSVSIESQKGGRRKGIHLPGGREV